MNRVDTVNRRYAATESVLRAGAELVCVGDPHGARLNAAVRSLLLAVRDDGPGIWDDLVGAAKSLRWRVATQPQPIDRNVALRDGAERVAVHAELLRGAVADESLLDELATAAAAVGQLDPAVGPILWRSIEEVGPSECVVIAANRSAQASLEEWLGQLEVLVLTPSGLDREPIFADQAYVLGPPRFFPASLVTAPVTTALSFLVPAWFGDRSIPRSAIAPYAEGAIRVASRIFIEGDISEPEVQRPEVEVADDFLPAPVWRGRQSADREPTTDEVEARKVLLSGSLAMWLDDGERIRTLDPHQPAGERVTYAEVNAVQAGTFLLLRKGETERRALHEAALALLGARGMAADATQRAWKQELTQRLQLLGYRDVVRELRKEGVTSADRARAWTDPSLVRPHSDHDFEALLRWLGIPIQPTFGHATMVRRALYQASADIREQLEAAVSDTDLSLLERDGHVSLEVKAAGFRGIMATRVLATSPYTEIVARHDARVPFEDGSGQWLE